MPTDDVLLSHDPFRPLNPNAMTKATIAFDGHELPLEIKAPDGRIFHQTGVRNTSGLMVYQIDDVEDSQESEA